MNQNKINIMLDNLLKCQLTEEPQAVAFLTDEPNWANYVCYPRTKTDPRFTGVFGLSLDPNPELAKLKAVAECLERIALYNFTSTVQKQLEPKELILSDDWNRHLQIGETQEPCHFVNAVELPSNQNTLLPAQLVYLNCPRESVNLRLERTSCGTACGSAEDDSCILRGLLELLERHYCYAAFYLRSPVYSIQSFPDSTQEMLDKLGFFNMTAKLISIKNELNLQVVIAMIFDHRAGYPAVRCGSKASFAFDDACQGAICEALQSRRIMRIMKSAGRLPSVEVKHASQVRNALHRYLYWQSPCRAQVLLDHFNPLPPPAENTLEQSTLMTLETLINKLSSFGCRLFLRDVTPNELVDYGVRVVRVIATGLHTLPQDEKAFLSYLPDREKDPEALPHPWA